MISYNTRLRVLREGRGLQARSYEFWSAEEIEAVWARRNAGATWGEIAAWLLAHNGRPVDADVVRCAAWNWRTAGKMLGVTLRPRGRG